MDRTDAQKFKNHKNGWGPIAVRRIITSHVCIIIFLAAMATPAVAAEGAVLSQLQSKVIVATKSWESTVIQAAHSLFWILATIEFAISAIWLAIQAPAIDAWFGELVRRVIFIGFFAFVLDKGPDFAKAIVSSLFQIGGGNDAASPADVFNAGISVATALSKNAKFGLLDNIGLSIAAILAMVIVVICFSLVAAIFISVLVEMYVGLLAGMIMLGLGGSSFTKDFAIRYLVYAFSVGMKLMALVMIARIGADILTGMADDVSADTQYVTMLAIAGISVVIFMISVSVPPIMQGVVQGASVSNGMEVFKSTSQVGGFAASSLGGLIGGGNLVNGAKGAYEAARNEGVSSGHAAGKAAIAAFGALAAGSADKLSGAPGSYGASALGLANAKLRENTNASKPMAASMPANKTSPEKSHKKGS